MRKLVLVMFVAFTALVFGASSVAQRRRGRGRPAGRTAAVAVPSSPQIAAELNGIAWGWSHEQVVAFFRAQITARYQPMLKNKGQIEQDRLISQRDREVQELQRSFIEFNGQPLQRRWDTSFIADEYTHGNNESMLVHTDPAGNREFFFFFNDRLWKRFQARERPRGSQLDFAAFSAGVEQVFGRGLHIPKPEAPDQLLTIVWQDETTRLHLLDNATFFNVFCLIYEERATLDRLAELRRNAPAKNANANANAAAQIDQPQVGNIEADSNADIVDRLTGKIRHAQTVAPGANAGANAGARPAPGSNNNGTAPAAPPPPPPREGNTGLEGL